jgi:hypothetical protein
MKIKKNIASTIFCKYSKCMNDLLDPNKQVEKNQQSSQFSEVASTFEKMIRIGEVLV